MAIVLKKFLIITISCLACFLSAQQSFAKQQSVSPSRMEMQTAFEELDKVLRIFDLGEIEDHLRGLNRSDPASMAEVYLILAYHSRRVEVDVSARKARLYFDMGKSLITSGPGLEQLEFYKTYEAIFYFLIYQNKGSKESQLDASVRILNMTGYNKIQKYIKCRTFIDVLTEGNPTENIDVVALSAGYCSEKDGLRYFSYFGAVFYGQMINSSFDERKRHLSALEAFFYKKSMDPYAQLEIAVALSAGAMGIMENELSLKGSFLLKELVVNLGFENTHLHIASIFVNAVAVRLWGNEAGYQQLLDEAKKIITISGNSREFLNELDTEILAMASTALETEDGFEIIMERWKVFERGYDGKMQQLYDWQVAVDSLAQYLYFIMEKKSEAIEVLNSFINMHDRGPAKAEPYVISNEYSKESLILFRELNNTLAFDDVVEFKVLPFIYHVHALLADFLKYEDNDEMASYHYELAWKRMPKGLKLRSPDGLSLLEEQLVKFQEEENYQEALKTSSRILDIIEETIFSSQGPFAIQHFEKSSTMRHQVIMAMYEHWFAYIRNSDENPEEAQDALDEVFRGLQTMRSNRLTKFYKTDKRGTALNDIFDLKKYLKLSETSGNNNINKNGTRGIEIPKLDRSYKFSNLKDIQSKLSGDTVIIAAYDTGSSTQFAMISSFWFDPFVSEVDIEDMSERMALVVNSAKNSNQPEQFDYKNANWLYSKIFTPEEKYNLLMDKDFKNIVFLPSKTMFNFPISLLHNGQKIQSDNKSIATQYDPNGFLIDNYYISYAVDLSDDMLKFSDEEVLFGSTYTTVGSSTFFAFADPYLGNDKAAEMRGITYVDVYQPDLKNLPLESLPETLDEVNAAAQYFEQNNVTIMSGETATKENILASPLHEYDVLMFSTHGISSGGIPGYQGSGLLLSLPTTFDERIDFKDVLLTPEDVLGLNLNADIVILNACDSGISDVANAPGLTGLAQSFLAAGSDAVMVTHWPISSATTVQITKRMFETIKQDPKASFNRALTDAQLSIKADPKTQHPFYWAPYNIYGNF